MNIGGKNFTNFENLRLKGNKLPGSGQVAAEIRLSDGSSSGTEATLSIGATTLDASRAWILPNRSGRFCTMGSFSVDFPSIAATTFSFTTQVTVSGITAQDIITITPNATMAANSTARIFSGATPGAGVINLYFTNIGSAANGLYSQVYAFTATRD